MSLLDKLYCSNLFSQNKYFAKGWGDIYNLSKILFPSNKKNIKYPDIKWQVKEVNRFYCVDEGEFLTSYTATPMPSECQIAKVRFVKPIVAHGKKFPTYISFCASGDETYRTREKNYAIPLARKGVGTIMLQSPFYASRRPKDQEGPCLRTVEDLLLLGASSIEEGRSLVLWLKENGYKKIGTTGISRGGTIASIVSSTTPIKLATCTFISPHSGVPVFLEGLLKNNCDWHKLNEGLKETKKLFKEEDSQLLLKRLLSITDIRNCEQPVSTKSAVFIGALDDLIVHRHSVNLMHNSWPNSSLIWTKGGHVSSYLLRFSKYVKSSYQLINKL